MLVNAVSHPTVQIWFGLEIKCAHNKTKSWFKRCRQINGRVQNSKGELLHTIYIFHTGPPEVGNANTQPGDDF